ncbi:PAS domain-containing protein [Halioxenophilus sp. WMMB6]|uniref:PAS domain-containing hybrid sensor histidine kinase/response regulator n=1 Tax=Halioxenophilus sp. WMMB6 TaxID=3073815 RepID=UPI00295F09A1|nr:PAS domain-containing protein [Halioxenophilus sp. WMMB6]
MANHSLSQALQWLQDLQLTDEQLLTVKRYRSLMGIRGFASWRWNYRDQGFRMQGQLCLDAGYGVDEIDGLSSTSQVRNLFHPDDLDRSVAIIRHHTAHKTPFHFSFRLLKKSGGYLWVTAMANSIRSKKGLITDIVGVAFDASQLQITQEALRTAELRLQRIMNASNDGIWEWNASTNSFDCSDRVLHALGFHSFEELAQDEEHPLKGWTRRIHAEDYPAFKEALNRSLKQQLPFDYSYRIADRHGLYRWVRTRSFGIYNSDGKPLVVSGTNIDITEIKQAQERLARARDEAESANISKSKFLSGMSQELRTPMNAILGYAQLFEFDSNLSNEQWDNIREIRKAGEHLIQLIDDVLDLSKIESGHITLNMEPVMVADVVRDCITLSHPQANQYGVTITADLDDAEPLYAECDRVRLKQVLLNLISNGIKYNRESGWVNLNLFVHDAEELCISVEDNGQGIPEPKQQELFQPFNRLGAEKTAIEGTGVGLVITKRLVEMMAGDISVYSQENVGSCFEIHLRRCFEWSSQEVLSLDSLINEKRKITLDISTPKTVLYIEDNSANVRLMNKLFQHIRNLQLEVAEEPLLGVFKARTQKPDLILLDLTLENVEGFEILEILKNDPTTGQIPKLAFTGGTSPQETSRYEQLGIITLLSKPINIEQLINALQMVFQNQASLS